MTPNFLDVVWLTFCGTLVFLMQVGFLCLEAGSTRSKNRINVLTKNLSDMAVSVLIFWMVGYGFMFGNSFHGGLGVDRFFPNLGENKDIWTGSFFLFQAMFCSTAVTILSGAAAERIRFKGYLAIALLVSGVVYPVFGHWVWQGIDRGLPGGWLAEQGFVDFAGSTVVHSLGGWCSLATILVLGSRLGRFSPKRQYEAMASSDSPMAFLGTMLLWFGWFGFNGGSNLVFNADVANVMANTLIAGVAGVMYPLVLLSLRRKPVLIRPLMNGALAGLVAVTAGCHAYSSVDALLIGAAGSAVMMVAEHVLERCRIDDVVGAIPVHLAAGIWGTLAVGLFGNLERLDTGLNRFEQIRAQLSGILACGLWAFSLTLLSVFVLNRVGMLRVSPRHEYIGLNASEHGASSQVKDVYSVMRHHATTGDLRRRVATADPFTEVGRVGQWYNQVIAALEAAITTNEAIINTALDGILTLSRPSLRIQSANPAAENIFGYPMTSLIGKPVQVLLAAHQSLSEQQLTAIAGANEPYSLTGERADTGKFPIEITATAAQVEGNAFFTVFLKDISARRLAEKGLLASKAEAHEKAIALEQAMVQLRRTQAQLIQRERIAGQGQLVAGIAHEINNPVSFIHGNLEHAKTYIQDLLHALETYREQAQRPPQSRRQQLDAGIDTEEIDYIAADYPKLFASMQAGTQRIRSIVEQLRNFSRYDEAELKSVNVQTGLDSTLMVIDHRFAATARRAAIEVVKQYDTLPDIECYANALNRAFLNILTNAVDAFDRQANERAVQGTKEAISPPKILIKTRPLKSSTQNSIQICISNNGPTISPADQKKIFDPFFTTQPIGQGTGLGCTISYQIVVEQHHGELRCQSCPSKGTTFTIELPLAQSTVTTHRLNPVKQPSEQLDSADLPTELEPLSLAPSPTSV